MKRNGLAEDPKVLDLEARNNILQGLADAKNIAKEVDVRLASLPAWVYAENSPLGADRQKLLDAGRERQLAAPVVVHLETRLTVNGPIWADLSAMEAQALKSWMGAVATQGDILDKYMPSEGQKELRTFALLTIALGTLFGPLLFTEDVDPAYKPLRRLGPPDWLRDGRLVPNVSLLPPLPATPRIQIPIRIPASGSAPSMPLMRTGVPLTAADFSRIQVPVAMPFQGSGPAGTMPEGGAASKLTQMSPGVFRAGTPPGPSAPGPSMRPLGPGPHMPIYPRYSR